MEEQQANSNKPKRKRQRVDPSKIKKQSERKDDELIRLNKFLAHSGVCSRRDADKLISSGQVKVNGEVVTEMGHKVNVSDRVEYKDKVLQRERLVYVLLNKPKGFITSLEDPFERKTVMSLVENAVQERIYPVGRLDTNTTGLLLFTNDGDIAKKMTHPSHNIKKIYHIVLDTPLTKNHFNEIEAGIELDDGPIKPDAVAYVENTESRKEVGLEIHSGRNRIVRRIFEHFEYKVVKLDRVKLGGLTKKDLPRGKWRYLLPAEINMLKMLS
jgi:23S rRNA pseudouridine2605 synthase